MEFINESQEIKFDIKSKIIKKVVLHKLLRLGRESQIMLRGLTTFCCDFQIMNIVFIDHACVVSQGCN